MKTILPFLLIAPLTFTSCEKKAPQKSESPKASPPANISTSFSGELANVVSNLETNGSHFSITHIDDDLSQLAKAVDTILDIARKSEGEIPADLNIVKLIKDLGLSNIDAMGRSSRESNGLWHNRFFLQTNGDRSGLLSIIGGEGTTWRAGELAPSDADLVVEFELNLRDLLETIKTVSASFGEEAEEGIALAMQEKAAGGMMTIADIFGKTNLRTTIIVSLDREKQWNATEDLRLPTINAAIQIERGIWLWKQFGKDIEKGSEVTERDGLKIIKAPEEMETPMGKLRPIIIIDEAKDLIWVSLTEDFLIQCQSKTSTLASSPDFKQATAGFPSKGNVLCYVSADFCEELFQQISNAAKNPALGSEEAGIITAVFSLIGFSNDVNFTHGYASCLSNTPTGILSVDNSPIPDKGYGMMTGIVPIASMAGLTAPMVVRQRSKATQVQALSNSKQLYLALLEYESEYGQYPAQLSDLVDKELIDEDTLSTLTFYSANGNIHELIYIPGLRSSMKPNTIILHSPAPIDGKRICTTIDGAARLIHEHEFQELIDNQKSTD